MQVHYKLYGLLCVLLSKLCILLVSMSERYCSTSSIKLNIILWLCVLVVFNIINVPENKLDDFLHMSVSSTFF